ncbi:sugar phosphate isomerase/epimerase family protein [candidate division KSB1 bacterium]
MAAPRNRRQFLKDTLAIPAGAAALNLGWTVTTGCAKPEMSVRSGIKTSCCAYSYRQLLDLKTGKWTMFDFIDKAVELDFDGVELTSYYFTSFDKPYLHSLKKACYLKGLDVSGTAIGNNLVQPDKKDRDAEIKKIRDGVDYAVELGAPFVRVFAGRLPEGYTEDQGMGWLIDGFKEASDYAAKRGVYIGLENHGGLTSTAEQVIRIIDGVDNEWFALNLDTGNYRTDPYKEIEQTVSRAVTCHIKLDIPDPEKDERVDLDVDRLGAILKAAGYRGYVSIEYEIEEDPLVVMPGFLAKLKKAMA